MATARSVHVPAQGATQPGSGGPGIALAAAQLILVLGLVAALTGRRGLRVGAFELRPLAWRRRDGAGDFSRGELIAADEIAWPPPLGVEAGLDPPAASRSPEVIALDGGAGTGVRDGIAATRPLNGEGPVVDPGHAPPLPPQHSELVFAGPPARPTIAEPPSAEQGPAESGSGGGADRRRAAQLGELAVPVGRRLGLHEASGSLDV